MSLPVRVRVPGDKSISHRALILAALARGESRVRGLLQSADVRATAGVLRLLGAPIPALGCELRIAGRGAGSLRARTDVLECGNSGTTARLVAGVAAAIPGSHCFIGDASLSRRPMRRVADPLRAMGASITLERDERLPMIVRGGPLAPITWNTGSASAQVKSAVLLAAVAGGVEATVREARLSRDHTERMLAAAGVRVEREGLSVMVSPAGAPGPLDFTVPGDPSSAAFLVALAVLGTGGSLVVEGVSVNATRIGFYRALQAMGAPVLIEETGEAAGEPVGNIHAESHPLRAISPDPSTVASMIDELPLLACVAARAEGETVLRGAGELRVKESDRISAVVENLRALGVEAHEQADGLRVWGSAQPLSGTVRTRGDHRIAMAFGVLGALPGNYIRVDDPSCVAVSYPSFWGELAALGRDLRVEAAR